MALINYFNNYVIITSIVRHTCACMCMCVILPFIHAVHYPETILTCPLINTHHTSSGILLYGFHSYPSRCATICLSFVLPSLSVPNWHRCKFPSEGARSLWGALKKGLRSISAYAATSCLQGTITPIKLNQVHSWKAWRLLKQATASTSVGFCLYSCWTKRARKRGGY